MRKLFCLLVAGVVLCATPIVAGAKLPVAVDVFDSYDAQAPAAVRLDGVARTTREYDVVLKNKKKPVKIALTGVRFTDILETGGASLDGVNFIKVGYAGPSDAAISLLSINPVDPERPPLLLTSGFRPGLGPFATPAVVPGQLGSAPIHEREIVPFRTGNGAQRLTITPGKPGAQILAVKLKSKRTQKGQYKLRASVVNGTAGAARMVRWFESDMTGRIIDHGTADAFTTTNATAGTSRHLISVVVTERITGSTGTASFQYTSKKRR